MARIRSVHPSLLVSEDIADLTIGCQMHFVRLWVVADDSGRGKDRARWLKGVAWPIQDDVTVDQIEAWQAELADNGRLIRYESKGEQVWQIVNFGDYQKPSKPSVSKIDPPPDDVTSALKSSAPESRCEPDPIRTDVPESDTDSVTPARSSANAHGPSPSLPGTPVGDREWSGVERGRGPGRGNHDPPVIPSPVDKPQPSDEPPRPPASGGSPKPARNGKRRPRQRGSPARTERDRAATCWHQEVAPAIARHGRTARWRDLAWAEPRIPDVITAAGGWTALCNMAASDAEKAFTTAWTTQPALAGDSP